MRFDLQGRSTHSQNALEENEQVEFRGGQVRGKQRFEAFVGEADFELRGVLRRC